MKNIVKRTICTFLAAVMLLSLGTAAFAVRPSKPFCYYAALGDSIGWHVQAGREETRNSSGFRENTYPCMVYEHYGLSQGFYGIRCGWRAAEALTALKEDYYGDDYTANFLPHWGGMTVAEIKQFSPDYVDGIKKADLITLNFGSNDLLGTASYVTRKVMVEKTAGTPLERKTLDAIEQARQKDTMCQSLGALLEFIESALTDIVQVETIVHDIAEALLNFPQTWAELITQLRVLNPDATIVAVSVYNPEGTEVLSGLLKQPLIDIVNNAMSAYAVKSGEYSFVRLGRPDFTGSRDGSHLGDVGHAQVAEKVIAAIDRTLPCDHTRTTLAHVREATRLTVGYTGDVVCADCGQVLERGEAVTYHKVAVRDLVSLVNDLLKSLLKLHYVFAK